MDQKNLLPGPSLKSNQTSLRYDLLRASEYGPRTSLYPKVNVAAMRSELNPDTIRSLAISTSHMKHVTSEQCDILRRNGYFLSGKKHLKKRTSNCLKIGFSFMFLRHQRVI